MARKHIILVHGRSTKPAQHEKRRLVLTALVHGLGRVSAEAAAKVERGDVRFTLAYSGDVNNAILKRKDPKAAKWLTATDPDCEDALCEEGGSYDSSLKKLLERGNGEFTRRHYRHFLDEVKDVRFIDEVATLASGIARVLGLSDDLIRRATPDMGAYITSRRVGSAVRTRLQEPLKAALLDGDDVCLIAHSMGCIVAYDVLWKFSRMSEYRTLHGKPVTLWLTLGNPLGEPGIRANLYDAHEGRDGMFPDNAMQTWINISAHDDFVAHDEDIADDFREMKERKLVRRLADRAKIYTFWEGWSGANPHKLYGYLDHPNVGREIARWVES